MTTTTHSNGYDTSTQEARARVTRFLNAYTSRSYRGTDITMAHDGKANPHTLTVDDLRAVLRVEGLQLNFTALGLDPADLGWDVDDERVELFFHDGPLLVVDGYDGRDPDAVRAVADWFSSLSAQAIAIADELRDLANTICVTCDGTGLTGPDDADCKACSGYGRLS